MKLLASFMQIPLIKSEVAKWLLTTFSLVTLFYFDKKLNSGPKVGLIIDETRLPDPLGGNMRI